MTDDRAPYATPPRGGPCQSEHAEQVALFQWMALQSRRRPDHYRLLALAYAIPNGGHRNKATAGKLKAEGVKAGVSDIHIPVPRGPHVGLWIELKTRTPRGTLSPAQRDWLLAMRAHGHAAACCWGWDEARRCIEHYCLGEAINERYAPAAERLRR